MADSEDSSRPQFFSRIRARFLNIMLGKMMIDVKYSLYLVHGVFIVIITRDDVVSQR